MELQTITDLVNKLFTYYECNFSTIDWDDKIDEYVAAIKDFISFDDDLDEVYKKIRQDYQYRKLPLPHDIKKVLQKSKTKQEIKEYTEHPDNGKLCVVVCYKDDAIKEIRSYTVRNTPGGDSVNTVYNRLKDRFDNVKVSLYTSTAVLFQNWVDGCLKGFVWVPVFSGNEIIKWDKFEVA